MNFRYIRNSLLFVLVITSGCENNRTENSNPASPAHQLLYQHTEKLDSLRNLNTVEASRHFIQRALDLEKSIKEIYPENIASNQMSKDVETQLLNKLSEWSILWMEIAFYYSEFQPKTIGEAYGEYYVMSIAALTESIASSDFVAYRLVSPDHLKVTAELLKLKINILNSSTKISIPANELKNPRLPESFEYPTMPGKFENGIAMARYFSTLSYQTRELFEDSKDSNDLESINKRFQVILEDLCGGRMNAGLLLDGKSQIPLDEIYRVGMCLDIMESLVLFILTNTNEQIHTQTGLKIAEIQLTEAKANSSLLTRLKSKN
jgi:hypothetical protein